MGLDSDGTKFLFAAQAAGVSFRSTAMLGRQNFFPAVAQLQPLLDLRKAGLSAAQFLADSMGYAEKLFEFLGAEEVVAIDNSDYEGAAIVTDMNSPIATTFKNRFTAVFDGGCLEHVFNFPQAVKNCMEMLRVGGHFLAVTPANNLCGHGFYQFSPELYFRVFSEENGFSIRAVLIKEKRHWLSVADPQDVGSRVELQNNRQTYLFVLAKKLETREVFERIPQQSDYVSRWKSADPRGAPAGTHSVRQMLSPRLKDALRPHAANLPIRLRSGYYRKVSEQELLSGQFAR